MIRYLKCTTDKSPISYKCNETICFTVNAREKCEAIPFSFLKWTIRTDDGQSNEGLYAYDCGKPLKVEAVLSRPGFVRLTVEAFNQEGRPDESFDILEAGAGAEIEKLSYLDEIPADFDAYWREIEKSVTNHIPQILYHQEITEGVPKGFRAFDIQISTPCEGRPASFVLTYPSADGKYPLHVSFIGYAVRGAFPLYAENTVSLHVNAHGIENADTMVESQVKYPDLKNYGFDRSKNASNMTTYWRNMMIRDLTAVRYAKTLPCWNGEGLTVFGRSQGALQATTMAAHDKDVTFLDINIPWFCNLKAESYGFMEGWRPAPDEGLRYFDTVAQATRVSCPVRIGLRLGDYICPPSTTLTLYNTFNGIKAANILQAGTHSYIPHEHETKHLRYDPKNPSGALKLGKYRHYKGGEYEVIAIGTDSESLEDTVIYRSLENGRIWVRPKWMFEEYIPLNGICIKRFAFIE